MKFDTIDDPFADLEAETEESFVINRYRISRPNENELLFKQERSFTLSNVGGFVFFFILGGFFAFLMIYYIVDEGYKPEMLFMLVLIAGGWIPAAIVYVDKFTAKRQVLFSPEAYYQTNAFGRVTAVDRASVKSVYIKKTTTVTQGSAGSTVYHYDIKMNTIDDPELDLFNIQMKSSLSANDYKRFEIAEKDSLRICRLISEQWDIPVSIE